MRPNIPPTATQADQARTDLSANQERAVLVGVLLPGRSVDLYNPLGELNALAEAAGAIVVDGLIQKRSTVSKATFIGKGKVQELAERCAASDATLIIFDNDLAPSQIRNLEKELNLKILDRSELILDIFAARAQTHEARLQVELAQLQYTAPRLRGMWTHLERVAGGAVTAAAAVGGIGTRGPGERQIEIDRRIAADRISWLKKQIAQIDQRKSREVESRSNDFTVSLVGYTNSGKSTLMNTLVDAGRTVRDALFVTLDTKTARWNLGDNQTVLLSDTVGFVRDLPHRLVASFRATLEETIHADLLLHVVDASSPRAGQQIEAVQGVLEELGCSEKSVITVFNKMDVVTDLSVVQVLENRFPRSLRISARTGLGLGELASLVRQARNTFAVQARLLVPVSNGRLLAAIRQHGQILSQDYEGTTACIELRIDRRRLDQLAGRFPDLVVAKCGE